jgi:hypothetical protein
MLPIYAIPSATLAERCEFVSFFTNLRDETGTKEASSALRAAMEEVLRPHGGSGSPAHRLAG